MLSERDFVRSKVESLLEAALEEDQSLFLIDLKIGSDNSIHITLDGDQGVTLKDCMNVSRAIEHNLDRYVFVDNWGKMEYVICK